MDKYDTKSVSTSYKKYIGIYLPVGKYCFRCRYCVYDIFLLKQAN